MNEKEKTARAYSGLLVLCLVFFVEWRWELRRSVATATTHTDFTTTALLTVARATILKKYKKLLQEQGQPESGKKQYRQSSRYRKTQRLSKSEGKQR